MIKKKKKLQYSCEWTNNLCHVDNPWLLPYIQKQLKGENKMAIMKKYVQGELPENMYGNEAC